MMSSPCSSPESAPGNTSNAPGLNIQVNVSLSASEQLLNLLHRDAQQQSSEPPGPSNQSYNSRPSDSGQNRNGVESNIAHQQNFQQQQGRNARPPNRFLGPPQRPPWHSPYSNPQRNISPHLMPWDYYPALQHYYPAPPPPLLQDYQYRNPNFTGASSSYYGPQSLAPPIPYVDFGGGKVPFFSQPPPDPQALLCYKIRRQIEFYFSFDNLVKDEYLRRNMDASGWVSVHLIANFNLVKSKTSNIDLILKALQPSTAVEVQGDKIRRRGDWKSWILPAHTSQDTVSEDLLSDRIRGIRLDGGSGAEEQMENYEKVITSDGST